MKTRTRIGMADMGRVRYRLDPGVQLNMANLFLGVPFLPRATINYVRTCPEYRDAKYNGYSTALVEKAVAAYNMLVAESKEYKPVDPDLPVIVFENWRRHGYAQTFQSDETLTLNQVLDFMESRPHLWDLFGLSEPGATLMKGHHRQMEVE